MTTPIIRSFNSSAYALVLAYALILLSLWKVDMGLVGRPGFTAGAATMPSQEGSRLPRPPMNLAPKSTVSSHLRSKDLTLLHQRGSEQNDRMKNVAD